MKDLDKKNSLILYYLNQNARMPASQIAKKVNLSKQATIERIKKLEKKYINFYNIWPNYEMFGFTAYKLFFKFKNITIEEKSEIINSLKGINELVWVASTDGLYDFITAIMIKSNEHLFKTIKNIKNTLGNKICDIEMVPQVKAHIYGRDYLKLDKKINERKYFTLKGDKKKLIKIDELDFKIITNLAKNPTISIVNLSKLLNEKTEKINYKFKQIFKNELIKRTSFMPNEENYPYTTYKIYLEFVSLTEKEEKKLLEYAKSNLNLIHILTCVGKWDYELSFELENQKKFNLTLNEIKKKFGKNIKEYGFVMVEKTYKMSV